MRGNKMANEATIICKISQERFRSAAHWRYLWTCLLWVFGAAVVIFLVVSVLFFLRQDWVPMAVSALGTIAGGGAIKWVVDRRTEAVKEEEEAYKEVEEACKDATMANKLRTNLTLFGRMR